MHSHVGSNYSPRRRRARPRLPGASSSTSVGFEHPTSYCPAFCNERFAELIRLSKVLHSFATTYSKEDNDIVEHAYQEVMRHLRARQVVLRTVTPAELILNNSIYLSARILAPPGSNTPGSQVALSDTLYSWVARQHTLLTVAQPHH